MTKEAQFSGGGNLLDEMSGCYVPLWESRQSKVEENRFQVQ